MPPTAFEHTVNEARGYACLLITISSFIIVLIDPRCLPFWRRDGYSLNTASTGMLGIAASSAFCFISSLTRSLELRAATNSEDQ